MIDIKWINIKKSQPKDFKECLVRAENVCAEDNENKNRFMLGSFYHNKSVSRFKRRPRVEYQDIVKHSEYARFTDEWSFDDLDGDYCIITHYCYLVDIENDFDSE